MRKAGTTFVLVAVVFAAASLLRGAAASSVVLGGVEFRSAIVANTTTCTGRVPPPACYSAAFSNPANIALGRPVDTSSVLAGYETFHRAANLVDGRYGNASAWISNNEWWNWAQVFLGSSTLTGCTPAWFDTIQFGRDRFGMHFYIDGTEVATHQLLGSRAC